jgi:hypothetical protein
MALLAAIPTRPPIAQNNSIGQSSKHSMSMCWTSSSRCAATSAPVQFVQDFSEDTIESTV